MLSTFHLQSEDVVASVRTAFAGESVLVSATALAAALLVVGVLVGRFAPHRRRYLVRPSVYLALYLLVFAAGAALNVGGFADAAEKVCLFGRIFVHLGAIEVVAIALFYLILARVVAALPNIARDLAVAVAYGGALALLMHRFGVQVPSILAASGVVTLVVSLSLQSTLQNVIGGVALQFDGSISEGDWIRLPDNSEGRVREVRWRHTIVETRNWDTIVVPNSSLLNTNILVLGKRENEALQHRMWVYFQVDFRTAPERVIDVVTQALATPIDNVAKTPAPNCICYDLAALDRNGVAYYAVRYWLTNLAVDDPTSSAVRARLFTALARAGIPLAIPPLHMNVAREGDDVKKAETEAENRRRSGLLAKMPLFASLTDEERYRVASRLRYAPFCRGEIITRQGAEAHYLYIVTEGTADVTVHRDDGGDARVASVTAPTIFGEMGMLTGAKRSATVVATSSVECFRLDKADVHDVLHERHEVAEAMAMVLAERKIALDKVRNGDDHKGDIHEEHSKIFDAVKSFFGLVPRG